MGFLSRRDMLETRRWWDTLSANDGGVVHDASIRQWTLDAAGRSAGTLAEMLQQGVRQRNWERGCYVSLYHQKWLWINTYKNTIFRGLFTSINPSYFDVNYRGTIGFDPYPNGEWKRKHPQKGFVSGWRHMFFFPRGGFASIFMG